MLKEGHMFAFWVSTTDVIALNTPIAKDLDSLVQVRRRSLVCVGLLSLRHVTCRGG